MSTNDDQAFNAAYALYEETLEAISDAVGEVSFKVGANNHASLSQALDRLNQAKAQLKRLECAILCMASEVDLRRMRIESAARDRGPVDARGLKVPGGVRG